MLFCTDFYPPEEAGEQIEDYFLSGSEEETDENGNTETIHLVALSKEEEEECRSRVDTVLEKLPEIDRILEGVAEGWRLGRMGRVELTILRLSAYEILYDDTVPTGVAINEAVELGKKFGDDGTGAFINGVLAGVSGKENRKKQNAGSNKTGGKYSSQDTVSERKGETYITRRI